MSQKNLDRKGRWRCRTVAFRVAPEEWEEIRTRAKISGLTLQEYVTRRCQEQDVVVVGNPRVYKALKTQMQQILSALESTAKGGDVSEELLETIQFVARILGGMNAD
ncbi:MAG: hypothetical protein Q3X94_05495 [Oscillospiraceae bacterium]|nr:hypothetical protein [Oscillospiraceae bacterium]